MDYNTYVKAAEIDTINDSAATVQTKIKKFAKNIARTDKVVKELGNRTLKETGVDAEEPIQTVFYNDGSSAGGYVYFYLNFTDENAGLL